MTKTTKSAKLLKMLKREYVTPLDCLEHCGLLSLAQRVSQFRAQGIDVQDKWVTSPSGSRFKAYKIPRGSKS